MADTATEPTNPEQLRGTPPASNPGADDATAGIAKDSGGVSGAAHKDIPNPRPAVTTPKSERRRSMFGSVKGLLGLDKNKARGTASDGTYVGAAAATVTSAVAVAADTVQSIADSAAATVLHDESLANVPPGSKKEPAVVDKDVSTGPAATADGPVVVDKDESTDTATTTAAEPVAIDKDESTDPATSTAAEPVAVDKDESTAPVTSTAVEPVAVDKDESTAPATSTKDEPVAVDKDESTGAAATSEEPAVADKDESAAPATDGTEDADGEHKPLHASHNASQTNPDAIPTAGGKKLGEDHEGEAKIIPADPLHPTAEEKAKGAETDAALADNTAANTGSATGPPADASSSAPGTPKDKKGGLLNKLKDKMKSKNKK